MKDAACRQEFEGGKEERRKEGKTERGKEGKRKEGKWKRGMTREIVAASPAQFWLVLWAAFAALSRCSFSALFLSALSRRSLRFKL
jgi:hypothetical protein